MSRASLKENFNYNSAKRANATIKYVDTAATLTGTTTPTIWDVTSTKRLRIFRIRLRAKVTTILAGATVGDPIVVFDNSIANVLFYFSLPGTAATTAHGHGGTVVAANDAVGIEYGQCSEDFGVEGMALGATGNDLKVGLANTITTGVIRVWGYILGVEETITSPDFQQ